MMKSSDDCELVVVVGGGGAGVGTVVAGTISHGKVNVGDNLLLGPDRITGAFQPVTIRWVTESLS